MFFGAPIKPGVNEVATVEIVWQMNINGAVACAPIFEKDGEMTLCCHRATGSAGAIVR